MSSILLACEIVRSVVLLCIMNRHHNVWATCLEAQDIGQAITFAVKDGQAKVIDCSSFLAFVRSCFTFGLLSWSFAQQITFWPQMVGLLQVKDRRLGQQEVLTHVLSMVSVLHFLLVDVIDELLDLVLSISSTSTRRKPWIWLSWGKMLHVTRGIVSKEMLLKERRQLRDLEVFTVFCLIFGW